MQSPLSPSTMQTLIQGVAIPPGRPAVGGLMAGGIAQRFVEGSGLDPAAFEDLENGGEFARSGAEVFGVADDVG
jgi:hypothetical protein